MIVIVLFDTLDGNTEGIADCLAKEMGLHYNEI
jgi:flavodoxin